MAVMVWFDGNEPIQLNKVECCGQLKEKYRSKRDARSRSLRVYKGLGYDDYDGNSPSGDLDAGPGRTDARVRRKCIASIKSG
jgi:hypothetical protein